MVRLSSLRYLWLLFFRWSSSPGVAFVFFSSSRPPLISSYASLVFLSLALLPPCLSVFGFPASFASVSLASVPFAWFVSSGASRLLLSCVFLSLFLLGRFIFSSVYWPSVVLVHLLRNSVESQFLRDGVLPLGRVISYNFFVYGQARRHAPGSCC